MGVGDPLSQKTHAVCVMSLLEIESLAIALGSSMSVSMAATGLMFHSFSSTPVKSTAGSG